MRSSLGLKFLRTASSKGALALAIALVAGNAGAADPPNLKATITGTWEATLIGVDRDPGRCVSTARRQQNTIVKFHPDGRYDHLHEAGDTSGRWRIDGARVAQQTKNDRGAWADMYGATGKWDYQSVRVIAPDHVVLTMTGVEGATPERLRKCRW